MCDDEINQNTALQRLKNAANSEEQIKQFIRNAQNTIKHLDVSYKQQDAKINDISNAIGILQAEKTLLQLTVKQLNNETMLEYDEKVKQLQEITIAEMKIDKEIIHSKIRFENKLKAVSKTKDQDDSKLLKIADDENELHRIEEKISEMTKEIENTELELKQLNDMNEQEKTKILQKQAELHNHKLE